MADNKIENVETIEEAKQREIVKNVVAWLRLRWEDKHKKCQNKK